MPFKKIPINAPFWSNVEDESRVTIAEQRKDVMKDLAGSTIRRPALVTFNDDLATSADGMYYWANEDLVYIIEGKNLYSLTEAGVLTLVESDIFGNGKHVIWAESSDLTLVTPGAVRKLFAANGERVVQYDGTTAAKLTGTNDPVKSTHIIMFDTYLLSNELNDPKYDESILFSVVADPETWNGEFFSAENKSDIINAMHTAWDEIALFGPISIENFYNDRVAPFTVIPGGIVQDGTRSPWTIKLVDSDQTSAYFFLNSKKRVVRLDGRQTTTISQPINDILSENPDFENAEGEIITAKGITLYLLTINDRTFVYDYTLNEWVGEWGFWNTGTAKYTKFKARNFLNVEPWGITLCSDKDSGLIYKLDFDAFRDNGDEIRSSVINGWFGHNTSRGKRVNELRIKLKRGKVAKVSDSDVEPKMLVRWRDDGSAVWSNWRDIFLGFQGDDEFFYSLYQMGSYDHDRKYEFICTDNVPFSIVQVEEDVEFLR